MPYTFSDSFSTCVSNLSINRAPTSFQLEHPHNVLGHGPPPMHIQRYLQEVQEPLSYYDSLPSCIPLRLSWGSLVIIEKYSL